MKVLPIQGKFELKSTFTSHKSFGHLIVKSFENYENFAFSELVIRVQVRLVLTSPLSALQAGPVARNAIIIS